MCRGVGAISGSYEDVCRFWDGEVSGGSCDDGIIDDLMGWIYKQVGGMERREISLKDLKICGFDIGGIDLVVAREWEWEWGWVKGRRLEVGDWA